MQKTPKNQQKIPHTEKLLQKDYKMQGKIQKSVAVIHSSNELLEFEIKQLLFIVALRKIT